MMGYLHVCDWCGKTSDDVKGWRIVKIPSGPKPLLCSGECVILWEHEQAEKVLTPPRRRRWWQRSEGS